VTEASHAPKPRRARYVLHVASVAGLDREGLAPFPVGQLELVRILDQVLDLFDQEPRFQQFTLDGQSILLEDYLSIRPENFERIEQAVQDGKLLVGPWYVQTEPFNASAESLIRNLMIGLRTARVFGRPLLVGLVPDVLGLPAKLPQILKGFGIDTAVVLRGIDDQPLELTWQGDDGSQITLCNLRDAEITPEETIPGQRHRLAPYSATGHLLLFKSLDRSYEQNSEFLRSLPAAQVELTDAVFHSSPGAFAKAVTASVPHGALPVIHGTSREAGDFSFERVYPPYDILHYLNNEAMERFLTHELEPVIVWAEQLPPRENEVHLRRPQQLLQRMWRLFLENQSGAILRGTIPEAVNKAAVERQMQLQLSICNLLGLALSDIAAQIDTALLELHPGEALVVFNPNDHAHVDGVYLEVPVNTPGLIPVIYDQDGHRVGGAIKSNLQIAEARKKYPTYFIAVAVPAFGYTTYSVRLEPTSSPTEPSPKIIEAATAKGLSERAHYPIRNMMTEADYVLTDFHNGPLPLSDSLIASSNPNFRISAVKLPEDADRSGMIVRGCNTTDEPIWITLTPWRPFATIEVVTLDEAPTGGKLAVESNGAVRFKAAPHRILTFWFHD
jgi:hypothetical protein